MSEPDTTMKSIAKQAIAAARAAMGVDKEAYGDEARNVAAFAAALVQWDAARMAAESRRKPTPPVTRS